MADNDFDDEDIGIRRTAAEEPQNNGTAVSTDARLTSEEVMLLSSERTEYRPETLLLTWILLLNREAISGAGKSFAWRSCERERQAQSIAPWVTASMLDFILEDTDSVSVVLERVKPLLKGPSQLANEVLLSDAQSISFAIFADEPQLVVPNISTNGVSLHGMPIFCIEAQTASNGLLLKRSESQAALPMATLYMSGFVDIFQSVTADPMQTVAQASQIGKQELTLLWKWNENLPPMVDRCMHDIISAKMLEHPDRPAVQSWDGELNYGELDRLSYQLAIHLSKLGVGIGSVVPMCFEKSMWTVVALLAVMRAGGTFVLTDPQQPEGRLRTIATEVQAQFILVSEKQADLGLRIAPSARFIIVGPGLWTLAAESNLSSASLQQVPSDTILYIVFTSGSTGKPKGVVISHENFTTGALPRAIAVGYKSHSRVLDFPSYAFDVSIDCMLCTLSQGGCICVPSDDQRVNDLSGAIKALNVNMAHMTPSVARVLDPGVMECLEVLGLGGESLSSGDATTWSQKTRLIIAYGPSECTVGCTINSDVALDRSYTSIGKGTGGVIWIVDPDDHNVLVPVGAVGELLVEGGIVGVGYLNEPEKTSQVFVEDPLWLLKGSTQSPGRHGRLYKSGDLVRYDPDGSGSIVFVGRKDRQVKLRGQRVELAEIDFHLQKRLPAGTGVTAEVITPGGKDRAPSLVAFIAEHAENSSAINAELTSISTELQACLGRVDTELAAELPRYMIPTAYIPLSKMPLLVSCKVDRKRLHEIGLSLSVQQLAKFRVEKQESREPATQIECTLQGLWKQLLGAELEIGLDDNFFALGGDSLIAMKLVATARLKGVVLSVADIFRQPTLSAMASIARASTNDDNEADIPPFSLLSTGTIAAECDIRESAATLCKLEPTAIDDIYPCTPLQEGLMALSAKFSEAYIAQRVVTLASLSEAHLLKAAFETVANDCAILRTRIVQIPHRGLMQVVIKGKLPWSSNESLERYLADDRDIAMGLGEALARFAIVADQSNSKFHIVLTIHHALYDGWSMPLIIDRVNKAYQGLKVERPVPFKNFIRFLQSKELSTSEDYWKALLKGATGLQFPVLPFSGYQPQANKLLEHYVGLSTVNGSQTTLATAIRAAWALVAARYTSSDEAVFGETLTGRSAPLVGIEAIEGPIITTVPMRVQFRKDQTISEILQAVHDQSILHIPHEHMGLQHIRRLSSDTKEACELRTGLVLHPKTVEDRTRTDSIAERPADGFVPVDDLEAAREALKFNSYALMLVCSLSSKGFLVMASFDTMAVDEVQMTAILRTFGNTVQQICESPHSRIGELELFQREKLANLRTLSASGARFLADMDNEVLGESCAGVTATWIVDPADSDMLVPVGAVGELLLELPMEESLPASGNPSWMLESPQTNHNRIRKTGKLAKYNSDGSIVLLHRSENHPQQKTIQEPGPEIQPDSLRSQTSSIGQLRQLWSGILGIEADEIAPSHSFFELGGDSIAVMKLVSEARMIGIELSVAQVFRYRRLDEMARHMTVSQAVVKAPAIHTPFSALALQDVDAFISEKILPQLSEPTSKVLDILPARPLQSVAIDGTTKLPRYSARYELFYLEEAIDEKRLFESCQELVNLNEILRTVFIRHDDDYCCVVLQSLRVPIVEYDVDGDLDSFSKALCDLDVQTKMPLGSAFVKFFFVRGENGRSCLILRISHAQYDEICLPALLHQLSALYERRPVPESIPFSTFVYHVLQESIPQSIDYWRYLLKGSSVSVLRPDLAVTNREHAAVSQTFDISARSKDITAATLPTAAWGLCLARRLGSRDVTFGEVVSGRNVNLPSCDAVMGPCWQYVPVRVVFHQGWTGTDLLNFVQQQHIDSTPHQGIGLSELVRECTDWPEATDWFDSVVHQDVEHVENLAFLSSTSRMETYYPHAEPLREWKIQAFLKGDSLTLEIVTFESWSGFARDLLHDLGSCLDELVQNPSKDLFDNTGSGAGVDGLRQDVAPNDLPVSSESTQVHGSDPSGIDQLAHSGPVMANGIAESHAISSACEGLMGNGHGSTTPMINGPATSESLSSSRLHDPDGLTLVNALPGSMGMQLLPPMIR